MTTWVLPSATSVLAAARPRPELAPVMMTTRWVLVALPLSEAGVTAGDSTAAAQTGV